MVFLAPRGPQLFWLGRCFRIGIQLARVWNAFDRRMTNVGAVGFGFCFIPQSLWLLLAPCHAAKNSGRSRAWWKSKLIYICCAFQKETDGCGVWVWVSFAAKQPVMDRGGGVGWGGGVEPTNISHFSRIHLHHCFLGLFHHKVAQSRSGALCVGRLWGVYMPHVGR